MTATAVPAVAVVVANRGGRCLEQALAGVAWAAERAVADPADVVPAHAVPPGVRHLRGTLDLEGAGTAPWLVLVGEDEVVSAEFADTVARAVGAGGPTALAVGHELWGFGIRLALPGARVRIAPRLGGRISLAGGLTIALATAQPAPVQHQARLVRVVPAMDQVVAALDADSSMLAAILEESAARPRVGAVVGASLTAAGRVLLARARERGGLARWVLAVLIAYRALLAYAKLWERARARPGGTL